MSAKQNLGFGAGRTKNLAKKFRANCNLFGYFASYSQKTGRNCARMLNLTISNMKRKILSMFVLAAVAVSFSACEVDDDHLRNETREDVDWSIAKVTIYEDDWNYKTNRDGSSYYYVDVKVNEINNRVYKGGLVCCYMYDGDDVQTQLPCTRYLTDGTNYWTRTIDYDFYKKGVTIYVTDFLPDGEKAENPGKMTFRIAVLE